MEAPELDPKIALEVDYLIEGAYVSGKPMWGNTQMVASVPVGEAVQEGYKPRGMLKWRWMQVKDRLRHFAAKLRKQPPALDEPYHPPVDFP